jgi:hypothetical protein
LYVCCVHDCLSVYPITDMELLLLCVISCWWNTLVIPVENFQFSKVFRRYVVCLIYLQWCRTHTADGTLCERCPGACSNLSFLSYFFLILLNTVIIKYSCPPQTYTVLTITAPFTTRMNNGKQQQQPKLIEWRWYMYRRNSFFNKSAAQIRNHIHERNVYFSEFSPTCVVKKLCLYRNTVLIYRSDDCQGNTQWL